MYTSCFTVKRSTISFLYPFSRYRKFYTAARAVPPPCPWAETRYAPPSVRRYLSELLPAHRTLSQPNRAHSRARVRISLFLINGDNRRKTSNKTNFRLFDLADTALGKIGYAVQKSVLRFAIDHVKRQRRFARP